MSDGRLLLRIDEGDRHAPSTATEQALARNASTVAVLSIDQILKPDGYVAQLRAKGYVIEDP